MNYYLPPYRSRRQILNIINLLGIPFRMRRYKSLLKIPIPQIYLCIYVNISELLTANSYR